MPRAALAALLLVSLCSGRVLAASPDGDAEREALARVLTQVEQLKADVRAAQAKADANARVRFRYPDLLDDLEAIGAGISEHLLAPRTEPRSIAPLKGDYR